MLSLSKTSIPEAIRWLNKFGIEAAFFVPTKTGLNKSIIDAHSLLKDYLKNQGIHDFDKQEQGQGDKVILDYNLISNKGILKSRISLYRPKTKTGDPRFWPRQLKDNCKPSDLIAIFIRDGLINMINLSNLNNWESGESSETWLYQFLIQGRIKYSQSASRLLVMIKDVYESGWIQTLKNGDTGVGYTLERRLGIEQNSSALPDFEGIEIKAKRSSLRKSTRSTLFAKVPDWDISHLKSSKEILSQYGYLSDEGYQKLYCTLSTIKSNSQGLSLEIDNLNNTLNEIHLANSVKTDVAKWKFSSLESKLLEKHKETFWVYADSQKKEAEYFRYSKVIHTKNPSVFNFRQLIESGDITLDHLIKESNRGRVREKGPLFKILPENIDLLIPIINTYDFNDIM